MGKRLKVATRMLSVLLLIAVGVSCSFSVSDTTAEAASKYPSKVTGVKAASAGHDAIKVSWSKKSDVTGYKVYRSTKKSSGFKLVKTTKSTSYTNTGRTSNKTYYYKVKAYKKIGKKTYTSKKYSSRVSAKAYLTTATSIKAASNGYNSIKLTWSAGKNAKYYQIYRATSKSGKYKKIATTTSKSYVNSGLTTNKTYYYKIRAYNKRGSKTQYSKYSGYVYTKPIPATPTNVVAAADESKITVTWSKVAGASKYYIYRSDGKIFTSTTNSFTDKTAIKEATYKYRVRAYRSVYSGYSAYTNEISLVIPPPAVPEQPVIDPSEEAYLNYNKDENSSEYTKIYLGQEFTDELNSKLNGGIVSEKLLSRNSMGTQEDIYCFDTVDFDNFLIVYVKENRIIAWQTNSNSFGVYKGTELDQGTPVSGYEDYEKWMEETGGPFLHIATIDADNIKIGEIYFGGIFTSTSEWDLACGDNLKAEEQLCEYTINALRVMNGKSVLAHNEYIYGTEDGYGVKAWAKTMAISEEVTHGTLPNGPLAGKDLTERAQDILAASNGQIVIGNENAYMGSLSGGESAANAWYKSNGHSQALMATYDNDGKHEKTSIMAAAAYKTSENSIPYWAWQNGQYMIKYEAPILSLMETTETTATFRWNDVLSENGYTGKYIVEFSLAEDFSTIYKRAEWDNTPYKRTGLTAGTTYYVRVKAQPAVSGSYQNSDWSNIIVVTIPSNSIVEDSSVIDLLATAQEAKQEEQSE